MGNGCPEPLLVLLPTISSGSLLLLCQKPQGHSRLCCLPSQPCSAAPVPEDLNPFPSPSPHEVKQLPRSAAPSTPSPILSSEIFEATSPLVQHRGILLSLLPSHIRQLDWGPPLQTWVSPAWTPPPELVPSELDCPRRPRTGGCREVGDPTAARQQDVKEPEIPGIREEETSNQTVNPGHPATLTR